MAIGIEYLSSLLINIVIAVAGEDDAVIYSQRISFSEESGYIIIVICSGLFPAFRVIGGFNISVGLLHYFYRFGTFKGDCLNIKGYNSNRYHAVRAAVGYFDIILSVRAPAPLCLICITIDSIKIPVPVSFLVIKTIIIVTVIFICTMISIRICIIYRDGASLIKNIKVGVHEAF